MSSSIQNLDHLKIPLEDILKATNHFSNENFIRQGGFGKIYKGKLERSGKLIDIVARRLDEKYGQGSKEFLTEILMLSRLKHENLVSLVGFCDEKNEKIVINMYESNESLDNCLSNPTFPWLQRLIVCVGVARALRYIHYDAEREFSVIHRNIKSSKILLDTYRGAKLSGFELSMTNIASRRHRLCFTDTCGTIGYVDPAYVKTCSVSHKSDIYSFGVVLFGRKAIIKNKDIRLAELAKSHYKEGQLDNLINPDLRKQMNQASFEIFSETAYNCLKEQPAERPHIDQVLNRLRKALHYQWKLLEDEENTNIKGRSVIATAFQGTSSGRWEGRNLEHLKIRFSDIQLATDNFADKYRTGSKDIFKFILYKAELEIYDSKIPLEIEGNNQCELPKKIMSVAIKRYLPGKGTKAEQMFVTEMEALISCKHPSIVSLLGFCDEGPEMIIVYECASNGSLADHLGSTANVTNFTWVKRIKICIDIAHGLSYFHNILKDKQKILHVDITSSNILLKENWEVVIGNSGLEGNTKNGTLRKETDIYCFGIVLLEILCWRFASDPVYKQKNNMGIASFVRRCFKTGTPNDISDLKLMREADENIFCKEIDQDSFKTFSKVAYQCLGEYNFKRPTMEFVIEELKKALYLQENHKDSLQISLDSIMLATQNFSHANLIGTGGFGQVYKGEVTQAGGREIIAAKRLDRKLGQGETELLTELEILMGYKHENIIRLVGYCNEVGEKVIVYEYASRGSLDRWLKNQGLTWIKRLKICVDIARGLYFLHGTSDIKQEVVIHRDIKSANILLLGDWKAKIADFGLSLISPINQEMNYVIDNAKGTPGYCDPLYITNGFLTKESDIYSFGVLLFEILCGKFVMENNDNKAQNLVHLVRNHYEEGKLNELVFEAIKIQISEESLTTFQEIAYQCIQEKREKRPTASDVLIQLRHALELQIGSGN